MSPRIWTFLVELASILSNLEECRSLFKEHSRSPESHFLWHFVSQNNPKAKNKLADMTLQNNFFGITFLDILSTAIQCQLGEICQILFFIL